ncbi:DUF4123 domain-containing protein [Marinobacter sp. C2H3]|uniref:DUF4123 domain-containing protein n=1 Tax=Marinobacter sp. C2H3 TaxID=3119003 RepID=UPI00300F69B1
MSPAAPAGPERAGSESAVYVVIEPAAEVDLRAELYQWSGDPEWAYLFADTLWQACQQQGPLVVRTRLGCPWFSRAWRAMEQGQCLGLVLQSVEDLQTVCQWLRRRLMVRLGGQRKGLLRYYDPLVWHRLAPAVQRRPAIIEQAWYWCDGPAGFRWQRSVRPEPIPLLPEPVLSEEQHRALYVATESWPENSTSVPD